MKRNISIFTSLTVLLLLCGCSNSTSVASKASQKNQNLQHVLKPEYIFNVDSCEIAMKKASEEQKAESRKMFMSGLDLLVNKNDAASSIEFFKEAICFYPDPKNYLYLFKAYLLIKEIDLADSANQMLEGRFDYTEVNFNNALIHAAKKDTAMCINFLGDAIVNGFAFKDRITDEPLFDFIHDHQSYQSLVASNFGSEDAIKTKLFSAFIKSIPEIDLPFELKSDSAQTCNFDHHINYDFALFIPGMENAAFSRDVSNEYLYVGKFKCNDGIALIYKSCEVLVDTLSPVLVNLIIYDSHGKVLSEKEVGCYCSPLESKGFKIWDDLSLEMISYKSTWLNDPLEKGYAGNKVVSKEKTAYRTFKIQRDNSIKETETDEDRVAKN